MSKLGDVEYTGGYHNACQPQVESVISIQILESSYGPIFDVVIT